MVKANKPLVEIVEEPRPDRRHYIELDPKPIHDGNQPKAQQLREPPAQRQAAENERRPIANELERLREDAERRRVVEEESQRKAEFARQVVNGAWERRVQAERAQALQAIATQQATANDFFAEGVQCFQGRDYWRAVRYINEAININPNDARYYYFRGLAYYRLGYAHAAQREYQTGASFEHAVPQSGIDIALERIQGPERMALERYR